MQDLLRSFELSLFRLGEKWAPSMLQTWITKLVPLTACACRSQLTSPPSRTTIFSHYLSPLAASVFILFTWPLLPCVLSLHLLLPLCSSIRLGMASGPLETNWASSPGLEDPSSPGTPRRSRTNIAPAQSKLLRYIYGFTKCPSAEDCLRLCRKLQLNRRVVQIWFQVSLSLLALSFLRVLFNSPPSRRTDVRWTRNDNAARSALLTMTHPCRPTSMTSFPPTRRSAAAPVRRAAPAPTPTTCSPRSISTLCRTSLKPQKARFAPVRSCGWFFAFWDGCFINSLLLFQATERGSNISCKNRVFRSIRCCASRQRITEVAAFCWRFSTPFLPALDSSTLPLFSSSFLFC